MPFNPLSLLNGAASEVKSLGGGAIRTAIEEAKAKKKDGAAKE